jgi:hypothetical protein
MLKRLAQLTTLLLALVAFLAPAHAQGSLSDTFSGEELVESGREFFGSAAQGLASVVERAVSQYGQPNGYILGEEAGGALLVGGGDGSKVMMLVYNLNTIQDILGRYPGVDGSAYVIGGVGMTVTKRGNVVVVPIRSGIGARLGINVGYLNFTAEPTWNPF